MPGPDVDTCHQCSAHSGVKTDLINLWKANKERGELLNTMWDKLDTKTSLKLFYAASTVILTILAVLFGYQNSTSSTMEELSRENIKAIETLGSDTRVTLTILTNDVNRLSSKVEKFEALREDAIRRRFERYEQEGRGEKVD